MGDVFQNSYTYDLRLIRCREDYIESNGRARDLHAYVFDSI